MKNIFWILGVFLAGFTAAAQPAGRENWNKGWTFSKDGVTRTLDLPHDWGVEGAFAQENPGETGKLPWWGQAVYSKDLELGAEDLKKVRSSISSGIHTYTGWQENATKFYK